MNATAAQDEILATRKVLEVQQDDNYKLRDHVKMLDSEVDQLRTARKITYHINYVTHVALILLRSSQMVAQKQTVLNKRDTKISELLDKIAALEKELEENRVAENEFLKFENENKLFIAEATNLRSQLEDRLQDIAKLEDTVKDLNDGLEERKNVSTGE